MARREGIRFRPPPVAVGNELRWVLLRAFGPGEAAAPRPLDGRVALELARRFEVSDRIGARTPDDRLVVELGSATALDAAADRRQAEFITLQRLAAVRDVASRSEAAGVRLVLLKFIAFQVAGVLTPGSRQAVDIDVLAQERGARELHARLVASGYRPRNIPAAEHHLPTLDHPRFGAVEIHHFIPGMSLPGEEAATLEALERADLLRVASGMPGGCFLPADRFLAAHCLVHGIAQHGRHPDSYSSLRVVADLIDIGYASGMGSEEIREIEGWVSGVVSRDECIAARELCRLLAAGAAPGSDGFSRHTRAELLLRHMLAGVLDRDYRQALNLVFFTPGLSRRSGLVALAALLKQSLAPSRGQLEKIHGSPVGRSGQLMRRIGRPFSLVARLFRYLASWIRLRFRNRR